MKKTILILAASAMVALVACGKAKQGSNAEGANTEKTEQAEAPKSEDVPAFDNENVAKYIELYDAYVEEYKAAVESKDMTKFQALGTKAQELSQKAQEVMGEGLSEADSKKMTDYMQEKTKQLQELAQKMMQ